MKPLSCLLFILLPLAAPLHASPTLDAIRKAGVLKCGIDQSEAEFSMTDEHGPRVAFDRDLCQAYAAAILGAHARVVIQGYPDNDTALQALQKHEVDLVASVSDDLTHATLANVSLTRPVLYDAQGLLVLRAAAITQLKDLDRKKICFLDQSEAELNLQSWFTRHHLTLNPFPFQEEGEMEAAFVTGNCAALSGDLTRLANTRAAFASRAAEYTLLPETIAADPLATAWRSDDPQFGNVLQWVFNLLLAADSIDGLQPHGLTAPDNDPILVRLNGSTRELGRPLGLSDDWPAQVLAAVGNYAAILARDLGDASPLHLPRGLLSPDTLQALPVK